MSQNGSTELTELQKAQQELLSIGISGNPAENANAAQANGMLMSVRLNALIEVVGQGSPEFVKLLDDQCLIEIRKLIDQIKAIRSKPRIALAS